MKRTAFLLIIALMLTTVAFASSDKVEISFKVGDSVLKINGTDTAVQTPYVVGQHPNGNAQLSGGKHCTSNREPGCRRKPKGKQTFKRTGAERRYHNGSAQIYFRNVRRRSFV